MDHLRHYPHPMVQRHLFNEIERRGRYDDAGSGIELWPWPRLLQTQSPTAWPSRPRFVRPVRAGGQGGQAFSVRTSTTGYLGSLWAFTTAFREIASEFFAKHWIDAEVRKGKRGGAFCASPSPLLHPYILCNYTDNLRDVMTVAHELGHGLHGCLRRKQSYFNYDTPLTTAETASVFGEMLVFDYLVETQTEPQVQIALLAGKLEDIFATVFRQNVLTRFEEAAFAARKERRLTHELLGTLWMEANGKYYGDAVEMPDGYRWGWSYIPHFIHSRFYCYSYVFGQLLVLALYRIYREEGKSFVPKYLALLESGGSDSPEALLNPLGINIHDPNFWQKGFEEIRQLIKRLEGRIE